MKRNRIITFLIALVLVSGMILPSLAVTANAEGAIIRDEEIYNELMKINYSTKKYDSPEEKLATMTLVTENTRYALYVQQYTAEVCVVDKRTGQMLFTNPYDVGYSKASASVKYQLLSQISLTYNDNEGNSHSLDSYVDAADQQQVVLKHIRGGLRVEFTIGEAAKKRVVPRQIEASRFEENILRPFFEATKKDENMSFDEYIEMKNGSDSSAKAKAEAAESFDFAKFLSFYALFDVSDPSLTPREQAAMIDIYPVTAEMAIYSIDSGITGKELQDEENFIRKYTAYSLEDMLSDHEMVGYELQDDSPAIFRLALEYTLNESGLQVRLPARGISYDATTYTLDTISILPFFGAGRVAPADEEELQRDDEGYNFIPDGSGAIVSFDQNKNYTRIAGTLYGNDYGFYKTVSASTASYQTWRMPVFGTVMNSHYRSGTAVEVPVEGAEEETEATQEENKAKATETVYEYTEKEVQQGYVAIITEGDSLARIDSVNGGSQHEYHSVSITVFARQTDSYPLDGITVTGGVAMYTKAIPRKYVGNYTIQYQMLSGENANYIGMANAYRNFLISNGTLEKISDLQDNIPLYMDLIGDIDTTTNILGVPIPTKTALTTFENAQTIMEELKGKGIDNQNVRYLGWVNGGMASTAANRMKVESKLGGKKGLEKLIAYAQEQNFSLFMDFDFSYVGTERMFDGFDIDEDTAKTIDGKTAYYKTYNPSVQTYNSRVAYVLSAKTILPYFQKVTDKYSALFGDGKKNIAVGSLGSALNSSQDEDYPLNREDAKNYTVSALEAIDGSYDGIILENGNAYTWKYADHLLAIPLDSSNRINFTQEVPFMGIVLHGYIRFAGDPLNLAGDYRYTILKTIENGANPYFVLAYDNTAELKTNGYGSYYAVDYSTWKESILTEYNKINEVLSPLQDQIIVNHESLGNRVIRVTYEDGTQIYLNYNNFEVKAEGITLEAMGFEVVKN